MVSEPQRWSALKPQMVQGFFLFCTTTHLSHGGCPIKNPRFLRG